MARRVKRSERLFLRVSPAEKALIEEEAQRAGLTTSEYIRREAGIGGFGRADRGRGELGYVAPELSDDFEQRVRALARTMPRRNAEVLARRQAAAEKAKAALAS